MAVDITIIGNSQAVAPIDITISGNSQAINPPGVDVSGDAIASDFSLVNIYGNAEAVHAIDLSGDSEAISPSELTISGDALAVIGNELNGDAVAVDSKTLTLVGDAVAVSGIEIPIIGDAVAAFPPGNISISGDAFAVFPQQLPTGVLSPQRPCPEKIKECACDDEPVVNVSSEDPDPALFCTTFVFRNTMPPLGQCQGVGGQDLAATAFGCSEISPEDAELTARLEAQRRALES